MIEKLIDDWLTNVSERAFEGPFAQLIALEGYTIVHLARPHGPMEQGKDILAFDPCGVPCAFQLKTGDLTLKNWRDSEQPLKGQVEDMLDIPIQHPSIPDDCIHSSALVTTGNLDDTLRQTIKIYNQGRRSQGKPVLDVWVKGHIETRLRNALNRFIVGDLPNVRDFLQLALVDGKGLPDCERVCSFLVQRAAVLAPKTPSNQAKAICAELVLLSTHLVQAYQMEKNHIGEIQIWVLVSAVLLRIASLSGKIKNAAFDSLGLVEFNIWQAIRGLIGEALMRDNWMEGDIWSDPFVYRARITHTAGLLAAAALWEKWLDTNIKAADAFRRFWDRNGSQMWLWGEGAVTSFLAVGWAFDECGARMESEATIKMLIDCICQLNGDDARTENSTQRASFAAGLADPYVSVSDILLRNIGRRNAEVGTTYVGQSYSLESLVKILAKRRMRQLLSGAWYGISNVAFQTYIPEKGQDLWKWSNGDKGFIESRYAPQPTSWSSLLRDVENPKKEIEPPYAADFPHLLLLFLLTAPHRLNPSTALVLEGCSWTGGTWLLNRPGQRKVRAKKGRAGRTRSKRKTSHCDAARGNRL